MALDPAAAARLALSPDEPVTRRVAKLRALHQHVRTQITASVGTPFWFSACLQQLLPLLIDAVPEVRAAAQPAIATLAASLSHSDPAGHTPRGSMPYSNTPSLPGATLLYDWAAAALNPALRLPPLTAFPPGPLPAPCKASILSCLEAALRESPHAGPLLPHLAGRVVSMCVGLLEAQTTGVDLLGPLLSALTVAVKLDLGPGSHTSKQGGTSSASQGGSHALQAPGSSAPVVGSADLPPVSAHAPADLSTPGTAIPSTGSSTTGASHQDQPPQRAEQQPTATGRIPSTLAHFTDVVDLLLGWSLEPSVPPQHTSAIFGAFEAMQRCWGAYLDFTLELAGNLSADLAAMVAESAASQGSQGGSTEKAGGRQQGQSKLDIPAFKRLLNALLSILSCSAPAPGALPLVLLAPQLLHTLFLAVKAAQDATPVKAAGQKGLPRRGAPSAPAPSPPSPRAELLSVLFHAVQRLLPILRDCANATLPASGLATVSAAARVAGVAAEQLQVQVATIRQALRSPCFSQHGPAPVPPRLPLPEHSHTQQPQATGDGPAARPPRAATVVMWAAKGTLELLLALLVGPPGLDPQQTSAALTSMSLTVCVAAGADEEQCMALVEDARMLGCLTLPAATMQGSTVHVNGLWRLRLHADTSVQTAVTSLLCDLLSMEGQLSQGLLECVMAEARSLGQTTPPSPSVSGQPATSAQPSTAPLQQQTASHASAQGQAGGATTAEGLHDEQQPPAAQQPSAPSHQEEPSSGPATPPQKADLPAVTEAQQSSLLLFDLQLLATALTKGSLQPAQVKQVAMLAESLALQPVGGTSGHTPASLTAAIELWVACHRALLDPGARLPDSEPEAAVESNRSPTSLVRTSSGAHISATLHARTRAAITALNHLGCAFMPSAVRVHSALGGASSKAPSYAASMVYLLHRGLHALAAAVEGIGIAAAVSTATTAHEPPHAQHAAVSPALLALAPLLSQLEQAVSGPLCALLSSLASSTDVSVRREAIHAAHAYSALLQAATLIATQAAAAATSPPTPTPAPDTASAPAPVAPWGAGQRPAAATALPTLQLIQPSATTALNPTTPLPTAAGCSPSSAISPPSLPGLVDPLPTLLHLSDLVLSHCSDVDGSVAAAALAVAVSLTPAPLTLLALHPSPWAAPVQQNNIAADASSNVKQQPDQTLPPQPQPPIASHTTGSTQQPSVTTPPSDDSNASEGSAKPVPAKARSHSRTPALHPTSSSHLGSHYHHSLMPSTWPYPAWHDSLTKQAALSVQTGGPWRPAHVARFFEVAFQEPGAGGLLLRRRPQPLPAEPGTGSDGSPLLTATLRPSNGEWVRLAQALAEDEQAEGSIDTGSSGDPAHASSGITAATANPAVNPVGSNRGGGLPKPADGLPTLTSDVQVAYLLAQQAAYSCMETRMRTHVGGPTQSFAALERMTQSLLGRLVSATRAAASAGHDRAQRTLRLASWPASTAASQSSTPTSPQPAASPPLPTQASAAPTHSTPAAGETLLSGRATVPAAHHPPVAAGVKLLPRQLDSEAQRPAPVLPNAPASSAPGKPAPLPPAPQPGIGPPGLPPPDASPAPSSSASTHPSWVALATAVDAASAALAFLLRLERCVAEAAQGYQGQKELATPVLAFFTANRKACEDWFLRNRDALLRLATLCDSHHTAVLHGWQRLADLRAQAKVTLTSIPASTSTAAKPTSNAAVAPSAAPAQADDAQLDQQQQQQQQPEGRGRGGKGGKGGKGQEGRGGKAKGRQGAGAPAPPDPTTTTGPQVHLLSKPGAGASTTPAASSTGGGPDVPPSGTTGQAAREVQVSRLLRDVFEALRMTSSALLALGEGEALQGLHAWAARAFAPLLAEAIDDNSTGEAQAKGSGAGAGGGGGASTSGSAGAGGSSASQPAEDPLLWILGMSQEAQGRYEAALHTYNQHLRQQHYAQLRMASMHPSMLQRTGSSDGGSSSGGTPTGQPRPAVLSAAVLAALQPFVAERCAACYTAVADWGGLQSFVGTQQRRAGATAGGGGGHAGAAAPEPAQGPGWWARFAAGPHMHQVYALASFDMSGVVGPEVAEGTPGAHAPQHALLHALHAITLAAAASPSPPQAGSQSVRDVQLGNAHGHSEQHPGYTGRGRGPGRHPGGRGSGGGGGRSAAQPHAAGAQLSPSPSPEQMAVQQAQDTLSSVWPALAEVYPASSAAGMQPAHAQALMHAAALSVCHKALEPTSVPVSAPTTGAQQQVVLHKGSPMLPGPTCSIASLLWPHITLGPSASFSSKADLPMLPQLHLGLLALPSSVYAPATHPLLARPTCLSPSVLTQLLRVQAALDLTSKSQHEASGQSASSVKSLPAGGTAFALQQGLAPHAPGTPSPTTQVLLLALALSGRASGNNDLTWRTLERLASLPTISGNHISHQAASSSSLQHRPSYPLPGSPGALSAVLGAARAGLMAEMGLLSLTDSAETQVACLQPFLVPPAQLLVLLEGVSSGPHGGSRSRPTNTVFGSPGESGGAGAYLPHSLSSSPSASPHATGGSLAMAVRTHSLGPSTAGNGTVGSQGVGLWAAGSCDNLAAAFLGLASWTTRAQATAALKRAAMSGATPAIPGGGLPPAGGRSGGILATAAPSPAIPIPPPPPPPSRSAGPAAWSQPQQQPPQHVPVNAQGPPSNMSAGALLYQQLAGVDWLGLLGHYVAHYQDMSSSSEGSASGGGLNVSSKSSVAAPIKNAWEHGAPGTAGASISTSPPAPSMSHSPSHSNTGRLVTLTRSHQPTSPGTSQELDALPPAPTPLVPVAACERHAPEAVSYLTALTLSPRMSRAWLQWGLAVLSWAKELKVTPAPTQHASAAGSRPSQSSGAGVGSPPATAGAWGKAAPPPSQPAPPPSFATAAATHTGRRGFVASTSGVVVRGSARGGDKAGLAQAAAASPAELEAVAAGAHALCAYLQLAASQGELSEPEDAVPALLRVLQVVVRHGGPLQTTLHTSLDMCPPGTWQALTPQLFAQLRHSAPGVRQLVLRLLQQVSVTAPFAVLYPALAEVQAAERSGGRVAPELQTLLQGLERSQPRVMADVRTLMSEAERLTVTWEERWHTILSELELDVGRRCVTLRAEAARVVAAEEQKATAAAALRGPGASSKGDSAAPGGLGMAMLGGKWTPGGVGATAAAAGGGPSWADRARGAGGASGGGSGPAGVPVPIPVPVVPVPVPVPVPVSGTLLEAGTSGPQPAASEPSGSPPSESAPSEAVDEGGRVSVLSVRYTALMSPVVHALERALRACQSCEPETPAERRFVQEVLPGIAAAIAAFKSPPQEALDQLATKPQVCWEPLKKQLALISSALSHTSLELGDVSPALAALKDTHVPMPGLEASHMDASLLLGPATSAAGASAGSEAFGSPRAQRPAPSCGYVTIMGVHPHLTAIPTKTRPKRIVLLGSDGCDHIFLLKGRDDLRMDERLMQIVRVSNRLMAADRPAAGLGLAMRHYSVTPLGDRVGLIQWVENTASLFSLFRSWQSSTRERHAAVIAMQPQAAAAAAAGSGGAGAAAKGQGQAQGSGRPPAASTQAAPLTGVTGAVPPPSALALAPRPIDVFYARLQTALMSAGVPVTAPRRQWPLDVLKKVMVGLAREVPAQLLSNQLWAGCGGAASWWSRTRAYTASLAASSCIGYLVGLGDRHLDNILLDTSTGQLVHIDYNVAFEKGLALRVPEVVPFRLTQVLSAALGAAGGAEGGAFRAACEASLSALRARREALVALVDAVLTDPLVGWASSERDDVAARRGLELAVTLSLFASRSEEVREDLVQQVYTLLSLIDGPGAVVLAYTEAHGFLAAVSAAGREAAARKAQAQAAVAAAQSGEGEAVSELRAALEEKEAAAREAAALQGAGAQLLAECGTWAAQHAGALALIRDESLPEMSTAHVTWRCSNAPVPLGLLEPIQPSPSSSSPSSSAVLPAALGTGVLAVAQATLPQAQLEELGALHTQGSELAAARDALVGRALSALSTYSAILRALLPPGYPQQSHHNKWGQAVEALLVAATPEALTKAKQYAPTSGDSDEAYSTWRALHTAHVLGAECVEHLQTALTTSKSSHATCSGVIMSRLGGADAAPPVQHEPPQMPPPDEEAVLELLADVAAAEDSQALQELAAALQKALADVVAHMSAWQEQTQPETPHGGEDQQPGKAMQPRDASKHVHIQQLQEVCTRLQALLQLLQRTGLLGRLSAAAGQEAAVTASDATLAAPHIHSSYQLQPAFESGGSRAETYSGHGALSGPSQHLPDSSPGQHVDVDINLTSSPSGAASTAPHASLVQAAADTSALTHHALDHEIPACSVAAITSAVDVLPDLLSYLLASAAMQQQQHQQLQHDNGTLLQTSDREALDGSGNASTHTSCTVPALQQAVKAAGAAVAALQPLVEEGRALAAQRQAHDHLVATFYEQQAALAAELAEHPEGSVSAAQEGTGLIAHTEGADGAESSPRSHHHQLLTTQLLSQLTAAWQQRHATAAQLTERQRSLHASTASSLRGLYLTLLGPCSAVGAAAAQDQATLDAALAASAVAAEPRSAHDASRGMAIARKGVTAGSLPRLLLQSLPSSSHESWGEPGPPHLTGPLAALLLDLHRACDSGPVGGSGTGSDKTSGYPHGVGTGSGHEEVPGCLAVWQHRLSALSSVHRVLSASCAQLEQAAAAATDSEASAEVLVAVVQDSLLAEIHECAARSVVSPLLHQLGILQAAVTSAGQGLLQQNQPQLPAAGQPPKVAGTQLPGGGSGGMRPQRMGPDGVAAPEAAHGREEEEDQLGAGTGLLPELVPFMDFDPDAPGMGMELGGEGMEELGGLEEEDEEGEEEHPSIGLGLGLLHGDEDGTLGSGHEERHEEEQLERAPLSGLDLDHDVTPALPSSLGSDAALPLPHILPAEGAHSMPQHSQGAALSQAQGTGTPGAEEVKGAADADADAAATRLHTEASMHQLLAAFLVPFPGSTNRDSHEASDAAVDAAASQPTDPAAGLLAKAVAAALQGVLPGVAVGQATSSSSSSSRGGSSAQGTIWAQSLLQHCTLRQEQRLHHLAAYEWIHEHEIMQAGRTGPSSMQEAEGQGNLVDVFVPGRAAARFFAAARHGSHGQVPHVPPDMYPSYSRQHLVVALQALCEELPGIDDALPVWEAASGQHSVLVAEELLREVPGGGPALSALHALLTSRQHWLLGARQHGSRLAAACAAIVQFEVSRQGAAWAPGAPLITTAFDTASALLAQVEAVYSRLGTSSSCVEAAQSHLASLKDQAAEAAAVAEAAQMEEASAASQFQVNLPMLVLGSVELHPTLDILAASLPPAMSLLCHDVGIMLKELAGATARQPAARDVASLAARVLQHHTSTCQVLEQLAEMVPVMQRHMAEIAAEAPMPAEAIPAAQNGHLFDQPDLLAAVNARGMAMISRLQDSVATLQPLVHRLLQMGTSVGILLADMEALTSAASSVAAAIQSEHALEPEAPAGAGSGSSTATTSTTTTPATSSVADTRLSGIRARQAWMGTARVVAPAPGATPASGGQLRDPAAPVTAAAAAVHEAAQREARRRAFITSALRRCILKLEGRDTWDIPALTAAAQGGAASRTSDAPQQQPGAASGAAGPVSGMTAGSGSGGASSKGSNLGTTGQATPSGGTVKQQDTTSLPSQAGSAAAASNRSPSPGGTLPPSMPVAQQVDLLIRQAVSLDNLCQMYEGWMPWV